MNIKGAVAASVLYLVAIAGLTSCTSALPAVSAGSVAPSTDAPSTYTPPTYTPPAYTPEPMTPRPTLQPATPDADHIYTAVSAQYRLHGITLTRLEWDRLQDAVCTDFATTGEGLLISESTTALDPEDQQSLARWNRAGAAINGCNNGVSMSSVAGNSWSLLLRNLLHQREMDLIRRVGDFNLELMDWGRENHVDVSGGLLDMPRSTGGSFGYCADGETTQSKGKQGACSWHDGLRR